jgi:hypothetical protein
MNYSKHSDIQATAMLEEAYLPDGFTIHLCLHYLYNIDKSSSGVHFVRAPIGPEFVVIIDESPNYTQV